jgi:hypothetical protein
MPSCQNVVMTPVATNADRSLEMTARHWCDPYDIAWSLRRGSCETTGTHPNDIQCCQLRVATLSVHAPPCLKLSWYSNPALAAPPAQTHLPPRNTSSSRSTRWQLSGPPHTLPNAYMVPHQSDHKRIASLRLPPSAAADAVQRQRMSRSLQGSVGTPGAGARHRPAVQAGLMAWATAAGSISGGPERKRVNAYVVAPTSVESKPATTQTRR